MAAVRAGGGGRLPVYHAFLSHDWLWWSQTKSMNSARCKFSTFNSVLALARFLRCLANPCSQMCQNVLCQSMDPGLSGGSVYFRYHTNLTGIINNIEIYAATQLSIASASRLMLKLYSRCTSWQMSKISKCIHL